MPSRSPLLSLLLFLALLYIITNHQVRQITNNQKQTITAYVNQPKTIIIPYQKCFRTEPQLTANREFIDFKPTKIALSPLTSFSIKEEGSKISVLDELRSPTILKHRDLLIFDKYLMILFAPNIILIVEEADNKFRLKAQYKLQNLKSHHQFKMYKLENKALLVIYNHNKVYVLNEVDYQDYQLPNPSTIFHIEQTAQALQFYAAQYNLGLTHYRLNEGNRKVQIVNRYSGHTIGLPQDFRYIVDVSLRMMKEKKKVYTLDKQSGLIQIDFSKEKPVGRVIVNQRNCESFDMINEQHFVLLCQNQGHSTIIQAHIYLDQKTKSYKYRKVEPLFQVNYYSDLHLTEDYYIVYSFKAIQVLWNTRKNRLPQTLETQGQLVLPGLQTFALKRQKTENYLYTIESGQLNKYILRQQKASLQIKSGRIMSKNFKLYMYGSCHDLNNYFDEADNVQACKIIKDINLNIVEEEQPRQKDYSISAIIIIILITIFLLLIWICLIKYKGLQKQARRLLQSYQRKRNNKKRGI